MCARNGEGVFIILTIRNPLTAPVCKPMFPFTQDVNHFGAGRCANAGNMDGTAVWIDLT